MSDALIVHLDGAVAGHLSRLKGQITFTYEESYRNNPGATPLSMSMPLSRSTHPHGVAHPFLMNLLPDNERVQARWAATFGVRATAFDLLAHVGHDCAGAIQITTQDRPLGGDGDLVSVDTAEIARRLRGLRADHAAWDQGVRPGSFSLGGAQAKFALARVGDGWADATGVTPTTHIFKPGLADYASSDLGEHLCMDAARRLALPAARTSIEVFEDQSAVVVQRYDRRANADGSIRRMHQEDLCQALGLGPENKYEVEGGPGVGDVAALLGRLPGAAGPRARSRFADALLYNWLIAGTDAHAKNYSILLAGPDAVLAPLYDIASLTAYDPRAIRTATLAMKMGGENRVRAVSGRHIARSAAQLSLEPDAVAARARSLAIALPDAFRDAVAALPTALNGPFASQVIDVMAAQSRSALVTLDSRPERP